ncbi:23S rRNA (uracil(1939)-C(5))-methyltransferase RlmD [Fundicoccus culcitae]|uniref:23S rRNA (Uracil(1939)-C(5))-methyltransferase RlmD n=1 Tax=Fundicoccus culcitae TaxID=2969821 RepID=A0ABY5P843_9LACT|nr:23S rRNA (uracil(1939)-C(5))-methyltransferase RlmD [Fundicoccus culcitae]UUX34907.1 23S rRNA (uracil(1939)-C(5))-methyltransferase RlmD [Fundicoccus culcitae]
MQKKIYPTEVLDVTINYLDDQGRGIVNYVHAPDKGSNGKHLKIVVGKVVAGDKVRVTIPNAKGRRMAVVEYDELLEAGPSRINDDSILVNEAGGTPLQFMEYAYQLEFKQELVQRYLVEKGFDKELVQPIIGMENPYRYRNKMELTFGANGELGMHRQGNFRQIIDMEDSMLAPEEMVAVKQVVSQWQKDFALSGYNKDTKEGLLRNLMMRKSFATGELMVVIFATEKAEALKEAADDLTERLSRQFENLASLIWVLNRNIADRTQSEEEMVLFGRDYINDELHGYHYRIWHDTFFQANPVQAEKLVELALEFADVNKDMRTLDLFCGVGTFSLPFAARSKELAGIEIVESSILSARRNAEDNGLDNTFFMVSDARSGLKELKEVWGQPDLLLLDPPRSGAGGKVMRSIGRFGTEKVVYVSCNPKSLAEDLVWLREFGYELKVVQPVDQFPHTVHVETVVLMQKVKG